MKRRVGLFGGTFDPVHNGHVSIADSFLRSSIIDELWVLLTPFPPHKEENNHAEYQHRKEMLSLAFSGKKNLKILTIENELSKPSYSINTILYLKSLYPEDQFFFCIGEDNLTKFHTWKQYKKILNYVELLVASRPGAKLNKVENYILDKATFIDHEPIAISSSKIKNHIDQKELLKELLPEKVLDFVLKEALYIKNG